MKPYIIGEFEGVPFEINNRYQVICEDVEVKRTLKELVIEGLELTKEKRERGYKIPTQFYIHRVFEWHKELPLITRRIYEYEKGTVIEHIEDQYIPNEPTIYIEGILFVFPFTAYTDFSVVCNCPEPDGSGISNWVKWDLKKLWNEYQSPAVPNIHNKLCYELMKMHGYKIQKAFIYKTYYDPNVIY